MTDAQKRFCDEYLIDLNATRAYKVAYKRCKKDETANVNGSKLLRNTKVKEYIEQKQVEIQKSDSYKQMTEKVKNRELEAGCVVPEELENVLRYYQKIGFQWLKTLDYYNLGGILADDMGLRKNHTNACCYCILFRRTYKGRKKALFSGMSKFTIFKLEKGSRKICKRHEMPCN